MANRLFLIGRIPSWFYQRGAAESQPHRNHLIRRTCHSTCFSSLQKKLTKKSHLNTMLVIPSVSSPPNPYYYSIFLCKTGLLIIPRLSSKERIELKYEFADKSSARYSMLIFLNSNLRLTSVMWKMPSATRETKSRPSAEKATPTRISGLKTPKKSSPKHQPYFFGEIPIKSPERPTVRISTNRSSDIYLFGAKWHGGEEAI